MATSRKVYHARSQGNLFHLTYGAGLDNPRIERLSMTSGDLVEMLAGEICDGPQAKAGSWLSGHILPHGSHGFNAKRVEGVSCLVFEVDGEPNCTLSGWLSAIAGDYGAVGYESFSGPGQEPLRARGLLPLTRTITVEEMFALLRWLRRRGPIAEDSFKQWVLWFLPRQRPGALRPLVHVQDGPALDPDNLPGGLSVAELLRREQEEALDALQAQGTSTPPRRSPSSPRLEKYGQELLEGTLEDIRGNTAKGGRKDYAYGKARRIGQACYSGILDTSQARRALEVAVRQYIDGLQDIDGRKLLRSVRRGFEKGLSEPLEGGPSPEGCTPGVATPPPRPPNNARQDVEDAPVTVDEANRRLRRAARAAMNGTGRAVLLAGPPGLGKSTLCRELYQRRKGLHFIVRRTREEILETAREIPGAEPVLGRRGNAIRKGRPAQFGEHIGQTDYTTCVNGEALRAGREGRAVRSHCNTCFWSDICKNPDLPGTLGMYHRAERAIEAGQGIIVLGISHLPMFLEYAQKKKASITSIWGDDLAYPGAQICDARHIRRALDGLAPNDQRLRAPLEALESALSNTARSDEAAESYGHRWNGADARSILREINTEALSEVARRDSTPLVLRDLVGAIRGERPITIAATRKGAWLEVWSPRIELQANTNLVISTSTGLPQVFEAWFGRSLGVEAPRVEALHSKARWFDSLGNVFSVERVLENLLRAAREAHRLGQASRESIAALRRQVGGRPLRVLVMMHGAILDRPDLSSPLLESMAKGAGLDVGELTSIRWRGAEQVGSNAYQDYDVSIGLGDALGNLGAWQSFSYAMNELSPQINIEGLWRADAAGLAEQAQGRMRWTRRKANAPTLHIAASAHPGELVERLAQPEQLPRPQTQAEQWIQAWLCNHGAICTQLAQLRGAPSRDTIKTRYDADTRSVYTIKGVYSKRATIIDWKADNAAQAMKAAGSFASQRGGRPSTLKIQLAAPPEMASPGGAIPPSEAEPEVFHRLEPDPLYHGPLNYESLFSRTRRRRSAAKEPVIVGDGESYPQGTPTPPRRSPPDTPATPQDKTGQGSSQDGSESLSGVPGRIETYHPRLVSPGRWRLPEPILIKARWFAGRRGSVSLSARDIMRATGLPKCLVVELYGDSKPPQGSDPVW